MAPSFKDKLARSQQLLETVYAEHNKARLADSQRFAASQTLYSTVTHLIAKIVSLSRDARLQIPVLPVPEAKLSWVEEIDRAIQSIKYTEVLVDQLYVLPKVDDSTDDNTLSTMLARLETMTASLIAPNSSTTGGERSSFSEIAALFSGAVASQPQRALPRRSPETMIPEGQRRREEEESRQAISASAARSALSRIQPPERLARRNASASNIDFTKHTPDGLTVQHSEPSGTLTRERR